MRLYSVFLRNHGRDTARDLVLVKEGFSWPAFIFTFVWALATRMWWPAIALFAIIVLVGAGTDAVGLNEDLQGLVTLSLAVAIGFLGNDIRRWHLDRDGYSEAGVVAGKNKEHALQRFLEQADISNGNIYP